MSGRIRTVKPEWLEDQRMGKASDAARLVSIGLILIADDHGRGRAHPSYVASSVWTYVLDPNREERASSALNELAAIGFVDLYTVGGQDYFAIRNWTKHQKVKNPGKPRIPAPPAVDSTSTAVDSTTIAVESTETLPINREQPSVDEETLRPDLRSPISDLRSPTSERERSAPGGAVDSPALSADSESATDTHAARQRREKTRGLLLRGYQERYEREANDIWTGHALAMTHVDPVATWVMAKAARERWPIERAVSEYLDRVFARPGLRRVRWPWKLLAVDPARDWAGDPEPALNEHEAAAAYDELAARLTPEIADLENRIRQLRTFENEGGAAEERIAALVAKVTEHRKSLADAKPKRHRRTA